MLTEIAAVLILAAPTANDPYFLGREEARPKTAAGMLRAAAIAAPPDICTGPYVFKRAADNSEMIGWPNDWINTEYQGGAAHTIVRHDLATGKDYSIADQNTGDNPGARGYPKPAAVALYALERWNECFVEEPPGVPSSYLTACNKPTPPGTQTLPGYPIAQTVNAGKKAAWTARYCATAVTPTPTPPPHSTGFQDWIYEFVKEGFTSGCGGGSYCPDAGVTRAQMAVFILRAVHGPTYIPPFCASNTPPVFNDVPCTDP